MTGAILIICFLLIVALLQFLAPTNQSSTTKIKIAPPEIIKQNAIHELAKVKFKNISEIELSKWKNKKTNELLTFKSLSSLIKEKQKLNIGYNDLLNTIEWQFKRIKILVRDGYTCRNSECQITSENLHVHHKYYMKNELPWEINDSGLVSLCKRCHKKEHDNNVIPIYEKKNDGLLMETQSINIYCSRCNGAGWFPQYKHVEEGVCFKCRGDCIERTIFCEAIDKFNKTDIITYENILLSELINYFDTISLSIYVNSVKKSIESDDDLPF